MSMTTNTRNMEVKEMAADFYGAWPISIPWDFESHVPTSERIVAALVFLCLLPVTLVISVVLLLTQGSSVLYAGERLGKHKQKFTMYKFRTLKMGAEAKVGGRVLCCSDKLETRAGKFLRATRLDEIPQLINVIKGEMRLVGPRPLRQAVYEANRDGIPNYDRYFDVPPGLLGQVQIFMPHNASKRIRFAMVRRCNRELETRYWSLCFKLTFCTIKACLDKVVFGLKKRITLLVNGVTCSDRRVGSRVYPKNLSLYAEDCDSLRFVSSINDIDGKYLVFYSDQDIEENKYQFRLQGNDLKGAHTFLSMRCKGELTRRPIEVDGSRTYKYMVKYSACSDYFDYLINKYILKQAML